MSPLQLINVGASADDLTGDDFRVGGQKINANFSELYAAAGANAPVPGLAWFNVKSYGAVGDGSASDDAAFSQVVSLAPAYSVIYVPPASAYYKLTTEWVINKPLCVFGSGKLSQIRQTSTSAQNVIHVSAADTILHNLYLYGNGVHTGTTPNQNVVYLDSCDDVTVQNCLIENASLSGIQLQGGTSRRVRLIYNKIVGTNADSFQTNASDIFLNGGVLEDVEIVGNKCLSTKKSGGVVLQPGAGSSGDVCRRIHIADNLVQTSVGFGQGTGHGIVIYITVNGAHAYDCIVTRNRVVDCEGIGVYVKGLVATPDLIVGTSILDNKLVNTATVGSGGSLPDGGIGVTFALGTVIKGNTIRLGGVASASAIRLFDGADDSVVIGNTVRDWTRKGIYLSGTVDPVRCEVVGNSVNGAATGIQIAGADHTVTDNVVKSPTVDGILVNATAVDVRISDNRVVGATGAGYGLNIQAGAARTHAVNNTLNGNTFPYNDVGTGTVAQGNRLTTGAISGRAVLVAGTVTVNTTEVLAGDNIRLTKVVKAGTDGFVEVSAIVVGTSFTILSSNAADTGTVFWEIVH